MVSALICLGIQVLKHLADNAKKGESWHKAAVSMDNPFCSCKLTRRWRHQQQVGAVADSWWANREQKRFRQKDRQRKDALKVLHRKTAAELLAQVSALVDDDTIVGGIAQCIDLLDPLLEIYHKEVLVLQQSWAEEAGADLIALARAQGEVLKVKVAVADADNVLKFSPMKHLPK